MRTLRLNGPYFFHCLIYQSPQPHLNPVLGCPVLHSRLCHGHYSEGASQERDALHHILDPEHDVSGTIITVLAAEVLSFLPIEKGQ